MEIKKGTIEKADAGEMASATISKEANMTEQANLTGSYMATCVGPLEHEREAYTKVLFEMIEAQKQADSVKAEINRIKAQNFIMRLINAPVMDDLLGELKALNESADFKELELGNFVLEEKWAEPICNVVTTFGANLALDTIFAGSAYTAAVVMGLKGTGTAVIADTQASHASWSEVGGTNAPAYSGTRKTPAWSSASAKTKVTSAAVAFTFTSGGTVAGCFMNLSGSATQDNTTGTLYSAGDFTGGSKTVATSDTLNVTYTGGM